MENYLSSTIKQFEYYQQLGDKTIEQLDEEKLFWQANPSSNSIAIIVNHLNGNMLSRWTEFLTSDGEKTWRNRDEEFEDKIKTKEQLLQAWNEGWDCLFKTLHKLQPSDLEKTIYIRNMGHQVHEAINRQMAHYAYHVGQIVFLGKLIQQESWTSLSIPKGKSEQFNKQKFDNPAHKEHYTEQFLGKKK